MPLSRLWHSDRETWLAQHPDFDPTDPTHADPSGRPLFSAITARDVTIESEVSPGSLYASGLIAAGGIVGLLGVCIRLLEGLSEQRGGIGSSGASATTTRFTRTGSASSCSLSLLFRFITSPENRLRSRVDFRDLRKKSGVVEGGFTGGFCDLRCFWLVNRGDIVVIRCKGGAVHGVLRARKTCHLYELYFLAFLLHIDGSGFEWILNRQPE